MISLLQIYWKTFIILIFKSLTMLKTSKKISSPVMKGSPRTGKIILSLLIVMAIVYFIVVSLDGGIFHWLLVPVLVKILEKVKEV